MKPTIVDPPGSPATQRRALFHARDQLIQAQRMAAQAQGLIARWSHEIARLDAALYGAGDGTIDKTPTPTDS